MIYKTIDLCAGIGGIRRGFELTGQFANVLSAEIDECACKTYEHLFGENPKNDLTSEEFKKLAAKTEYDVLLAGFPCQTFSRAGQKLGFRDTTKGTIFFDIADIISRTNPRAVFLENVENLVSHDKGETLKRIVTILEEELQYRIIGVNLISLKQLLDSLNWAGKIHIFGGLEPSLSTLYYLAGADIFDGLSWQRMRYQTNSTLWDPFSFKISCDEFENKFYMMVDNLSVLRDLSNDLSCELDNRSLKMDRLKELLINTDSTISEIIMELEG